MDTGVLGWDFAWPMRLNAIFGQKQPHNQGNLNNFRFDYVNPIEGPQCRFRLPAIA